MGFDSMRRGFVCRFGARRGYSANRLLTGFLAPRFEIPERMRGRVPEIVFTGRCPKCCSSAYQYGQPFSGRNWSVSVEHRMEFGLENPDKSFRAMVRCKNIQGFRESLCLVPWRGWCSKPVRYRSRTPASVSLDWAEIATAPLCRNWLPPRLSSAEDTRHNVRSSLAF